MTITRVRNTVQPDYAQQNKANIEAVMSEVRALGKSDFKYATFLMPDDKTFMHFSMAETQNAQDRLFTLPAFEHFRTSLMASKPEVAPKTEQPTLVAAGYDIF